MTPLTPSLSSSLSPTNAGAPHATRPLDHATAAAFLILLALPLAPSARLARDATDQRLATVLDGVDHLAHQAQSSWPSTLQNAATLQALGQAIPGLAALLSSSALGKAFRSEAALAHHQTLVAAYRTDHATELDAFFRQLGQQMGAAAPETPEEATGRN